MTDWGDLEGLIATYRSARFDREMSAVKHSNERGYTVTLEVLQLLQCALAHPVHGEAANVATRLLATGQILHAFSIGGLQSPQETAATWQKRWAGHEREMKAYCGIPETIQHLATLDGNIRMSMVEHEAGVIGIYSSEIGNEVVGIIVQSYEQPTT